MIRLDEAIKTFLIWKGLAHITMAVYAVETAYLIWEAFYLGPLLTTQQTAVVTILTGVLPVMLNWYTGVMAETKREA